MPVKSLVELCLQVCFKNIKEITDIGSTPYHVIRPVLLRIDSAIQLRELEEASPHIQLEDGECWERLIKRDYPVLSQQFHFVPKNPESWHRVYAKYKKLNDQQKKEAAEKLKNAFAGIQRQKDANKSEVITFDRRTLGKPPRDGTGYVPKKSTSGRRGGTNETGELRFTAGSRTKVTTAQSIMRKVKREAKEVHYRNKLATAGGALPVRDGQIKHAPQGMVHDQQVRHQPLVKIHAPAMRQRQETRNREMEEREARLRKLKAGRNATIISDSDLEDDDSEIEQHWQDDDVAEGLNEDDLEDIFDDEPVPRQRSDKPTASSSAPKAALLSNKRTGILSNAYRGAAQAQAVSTRPIPQQRSSEPSKAQAMPSRTAAPPPVKPSSPPKTFSPAGSPELKPLMSRKRKAPDVFMRPKAKVQRQ